MHVHEHGQSGREITPADLLEHMIGHNESHLVELEKLAGDIGGAEGEKVRAAAAVIRSGNEQLADVLLQLKEK